MKVETRVVKLVDAIHFLERQIEHHKDELRSLLAQGKIRLVEPSVSKKEAFRKMRSRAQKKWWKKQTPEYRREWGKHIKEARMKTIAEKYYQDIQHGTIANSGS